MDAGRFVVTDWGVSTADRVACELIRQALEYGTVRSTGQLWMPITKKSLAPAPPRSFPLARLALRMTGLRGWMV